MRKGIILAVTVLSFASFASAAILTENFDDGDYAGWTALNGTPPVDMSPAGSLALHIQDGVAQRISQSFTTSDQVLILEWDFYSNDASATQRSFGGFAQNAASPGANGALVRIGNNNQSKYQLHYWTTALQTLDTGVAVAQGAHHAKIKVDLANKTIDWQIDTTVGAQISNPNLLAPNAVVLGYNYGNGASGTPDTSVWFDNVALTPEPVTIALLAAGGMFVARRRRMA